MTELLRGKSPRQLLEETLTELETRANLTPRRYAALVRLSALLLRVEAQRIQVEETGGRSLASHALANAALYRMQAEELAAVLSERCQRPQRCHVRSSSIHQPPTQPETIDLVKTFQSVLYKAQARDAEREELRNNTRFRVLRLLRAEMMELRERRAALQSPGLNNSANQSQ